MNKQNFLLILAAIVSIIAGYWVYSSQLYDFKTLDNEHFTFSDFEGDFLVINYFAEWCAPCLKEVPELNEFDRQKADNVHLFAISYDLLSEQQLSEIRDKYDMQFSLVSKIESGLPFEKPNYLPATFIIQPDGQVKGPLLGEQTAQSLSSAITSLSAE